MLTGCCERRQTIVDNGIVSPFHFDWYRMSHKALLGTGRSASRVVSLAVQVVELTGRPYLYHQVATTQFSSTTPSLLRISFRRLSSTSASPVHLVSLASALRRNANRTFSDVTRRQGHEGCFSSDARVLRFSPSGPLSSPPLGCEPRLTGFAFRSSLHARTAALLAGR